jgi:haloalkane dehalogenase
MWPTQIPINGKPSIMHEIIEGYIDWLSAAELPKLCLYADPGAIIMEKDLDYIRTKFPNTKLVSVGKGIHYLQEDNPHLIGNEIAKWYQDI